MEDPKLNILLADDDQDDRDFFKQALNELSIATNFTAVNDGEQLIKHLSGIQDVFPDIIFLDINMPRKNGIECLSEIKQNAKWCNIPVVMFSTSNAWETINMLFKSGAHVYIHKPSDFSQLKQVIHHALPIAGENAFSNGKLKYILNA